MRSIKSRDPKKIKVILGLIVLLGMIFLAIFFWRGKDADVKKSNKNNNKETTQTAVTDENQGIAEGINIKVDSPRVNSLMTSPMKITGEAKGWYAEGSFPIRLLDDKGNVLAKGEAKAKGEWMKDAYVPFEGELVFDAKDAKKGDIIFEKSNPSGKPENAGSFSFGILFVK